LYIKLQIYLFFWSIRPIFEKTTHDVNIHSNIDHKDMSFDEDCDHKFVLKLADKSASNRISLSIATLHFHQAIGHFQESTSCYLQILKEGLILIKKIIESWLIEIGIQLTTWSFHFTQTLHRIWGSNQFLGDIACKGHQSVGGSVANILEF